MYRMTFAVIVTPDGLYHVQNMVAGLSGQHHVHSAASFKRWQRPDDAIEEHEGACCELAAGDVRDHTGRVSHKKEFE